MRHLITVSTLCFLLLFLCGCKGKPAQPTAAVAAASNVQVTADVGTVKIGQAAPVRLHILLDGKPLDAATVHGVLTMTNMDMGKTDVEFAPRGGGDYEGKIVFDMGGPWKIDLTVKHDGQTSAASVNINVPE